METLLLKPNRKSIKLACKLLKNGEVVGVPTETVYGLAGDCSNSMAIKKIFEAKGRPNDNPLIVHISNIKMLDKIVSCFNSDAKKLAKKFWPGPLTIIMPKKDFVCKESCGGLNSVGVRMPSNKIARKIIAKSNTPFSAPSANISGKPSPTTAQDVYNDMKGKIPLIIDGGECVAGVESTVISVLEESPTILRPGIITKEEIEKVLHKQVKVAKEVTQQTTNETKVLSPGMKYKHYSPNAKIIVVDSNLKDYVNYVNSLNGKDIYAMCFEKEEKLINKPCITYGKHNNEKSQAHALFSALRKCDEVNAKIVYARCPKTNGISLAVYNRLIRSAGFDIIKL